MAHPYYNRRDLIGLPGMAPYLQTAVFPLHRLEEVDP